MSNYDSEFIELLANRAAGLVTGDDLVNWAVSALEKGFDSPNLRILAGLISPVWLSEGEPYFDRATAELGIKIPEDEEVLREYIKVVARKIVNGEVSPGLGADLIHSRVLTPLGHPEDLSAWCFLWEGLDPETYRLLSEDVLNDKIRLQAYNHLRTCA